MVVRVFSIKKDGSYREILASPESLQKGNGAFLILDTKKKKIFIYRNPGIPKTLAYAAARAATNLNTRRGSKYQIINVEPEEQTEMLNEVFPAYDLVESKSQRSSSSTTEKGFVFGEKTIMPEKVSKVEQLSKHELSETPQPRQITMATETRPKRKLVTQIVGELEPYDVKNILKTLASRVLYGIHLSEVKGMAKPPRDQLRSALIKEIDALLDELYS